MTSCAGVCRYEGSGGACTISLSEPLLKLRPRKDLVETLLHEMIHAYLFVTNNNRDRDGHGIEFHKHMYRINQVAGTKITVYHNFVDEVDSYRTHWWRCDGPCRDRPPFFGIVKRATNRKPSPNDFWWDNHKAHCNGTFIKTREPNKKGVKKGELPTKTLPVSDIRNYMPGADKPPTTTVNNIKKRHTSTGTKSSSVTVIVNPDKKMPNADVPPEPVTFKPFVGEGYVLTGGKTSTNVAGRANGIASSSNGQVQPFVQVRNVWATKFTDNAVKRASSTTNVDNKKARYDRDATDGEPAVIDLCDDMECPKWSAELTERDVNDHLDKCIATASHVTCPICAKDVTESEMNAHLDVCLKSNYDDNFDQTNTSDNNVVNCLVCNEPVNVNKLQVHLERCMNHVFDDEMPFEDAQSSGAAEMSDRLISCPCCPAQMKEAALMEHIEKCLSANAVHS